MGSVIPRSPLPSLAGLALLLLAGCGSPATTADTPARPRGRVAGARGDVQLLRELELGISPEAFAAAVDRDPAVRPGFGANHEVDLPSGTVTLRPVFRSGELVRVELSTPRRAEDDAIAHLAADLALLRDWAVRQYGEPDWTAPEPAPREVDPARGTFVARWLRDGWTVLLRVAADGVLYRGELWIGGPAPEREG